MQKKLTVLFAFAIFVLLVGWAVTPVQAHPGTPKDCPHKDTNHQHCTPQDDPVDGSDEPIPVQVTFRDGPGDTITSDCAIVNGTCPYIDGVAGVGARMPVPRRSGHATEFSNRFLMSTLNNPFERKLVINFGDAVKCDDGSLEPGGACVNDATSTVDVPNPVECPFHTRKDPGVCAGSALGTLQARDVDTAKNNTFETLITEMPIIGGPFLVRSRQHELQFNVKKLGSQGIVHWRIEFDHLAEFCTVGGAEFLDVVADDNSGGDIENTVGEGELWYIGTGFNGYGNPTTRRGCLIKGDRKHREFVGVFDMTFEYEICILGSGTGDTACPQE